MRRRRRTARASPTVPAQDRQRRPGPDSRRQCGRGTGSVGRGVPPARAGGMPGAMRSQNPMHQFRQRAIVAIVRWPGAMAAAQRQDPMHRESWSFGQPRNALPRQNPMHQFTRLPPRGRPSGPEADSIDALPEPMHQFTPPFPQDNAVGGNTPCPADNCPTRAAHRLARSADETMVRLARDRSGFTISIDRQSNVC